MADATIGPGVESVDVLIWTVDPDSGRWDRAQWDGTTWGAPGWQSVDCDVGEVTHRWGASQESGILSIAEAGELDIATIDPNRELDPLNTASPYYGAVKPGTPVRIVGLTPDATPVATAFIDEASYDLASARGRIRAVDGIAYLSQAQLAAGVTLPNTLRARIRSVVALSGLGAQVPVEIEPPATLQLILNGSFADGMANWQTYTGPPGGAAAFDPNVGTYGRWQGNGSTIEVQAIQSIVVSEGQTINVTATLAGNGVANHPAVLQVDARDRNGAALAFNVVALAVSGAGWTPVSGSYTVAPGVTALSFRVGVGQTDGSTATTAHVAFASAITATAANPAAFDTDPAVAPYDNTNARPAWQVISEAALDALWYVWLDPTGTLRSRSWGGLIDAPLSIGCKPDDADPADQWLVGLSTIESTASADAVRNSVRAYSSGTVFTPPATDAGSVAKYGPRPFDVARVVPAFSTWASRILADRADAGLDIAVGEVRPYTVLELDALLDTQLAGPATIRVRDDAHGEIIDLDVGLIGARVGVTPVGWRFGLVTMITRVQWEDTPPTPPVIPPVTPPPDPWHVETRTYVASSDALIALASGGQKYGAGAANTLPIGAWSGWTYRGLVAFPSIPWTKIRAVRSATLNLRTTTAVRVGFGSSPKTELRRITSGWSAGSSSSPSTGNAVVWPGPNTTTSGAVTSSLPTGQNANRAIDVTAIVRAWAPAAAGGGGTGQYGIRLGEVSSSQSNTSEVYPTEQGGSARPSLDIVLEVFD